MGSSVSLVATNYINLVSEQTIYSWDLDSVKENKMRGFLVDITETLTSVRIDLSKGYKVSDVVSRSENLKSILGQKLSDQGTKEIKFEVTGECEDIAGLCDLIQRIMETAPKVPFVMTHKVAGGYRKHVLLKRSAPDMPIQKLREACEDN